MMELVPPNDVPDEVLHGLRPVERAQGATPQGDYRTAPAETLSWRNTDSVRIGLLDGVALLPDEADARPDLLVNWHPCGDWLTDTVRRLDGVAGRPQVSRVFRAFLVRDRSVLEAAVEKILEWDIDQLVVPHGRVVAHGAKDDVARGLSVLCR
jgi:hypothetical protein